ncbi:MAG TPA: 2-dehydropantoate 2-reductase [Candidatus Eremiobacteraceae bacterium]|nr:2-dehydropantoate 2-reductase [Candidatus Eremiobacteraceae bacterium]
MRCLIVGAGAVGQYFAARLAMAGHDAVLFARADARDIINQRGVTLRSAGGEWPIAVGAAASVDDARLRDPFELAIVAVKSFSTDGAAESIASIGACDQSTLLTVQNGLGNEEVLASRFGADRVLAGALTVPVDRVDETTIEAPSKGGLSLAPVGSAANNWVIAAFSNSGLPVRAADDWRALKWSKLLVNLTANAVCAALDMTPAQVYADPIAFSIERESLREAVDVMRASGVTPVPLIDLPAPQLAWAVSSLPSAILRMFMASRVSRARAGKLPSLLLDVRSGRRRVEVDWLNGAVAVRAAAVRMRAPANAVVTKILDGIAAGSIDRGLYRAQPDKLQADIEAARTNL